MLEKGRMGKTEKLLHIYPFLEVAMEKSIINIKLLNIPPRREG